jgi:AbrB family looped-hinge helix DNA binding protein
METTRLSTKGQVVLPKSVRTARDWTAGTEFSVEETPEGVLLRPIGNFPRTRLEDVAGCLKWSGKPKTILQMNRATAREVRRRHDRGRY